MGACCRGSRRFSAIVPQCLRGYLVGPNFSRWYFVGLKLFLVGISWVQNFFLVGISWVWNFFSWVFRGSKIFSWVRNFFSRVFRGPIFFLYLISWFKDFNLLAAWARVTKTEIQKYISNHVFFSKLISTVVNCLY